MKFLKDFIGWLAAQSCNLGFAPTIADVIAMRTPFSPFEIESLYNLCGSWDEVLAVCSVASVYGFNSLTSARHYMRQLHPRMSPFEIMELLGRVA